MSTKVLQFCFILIFLLTACGEKVPSVAERIQKVYTPASVTHDGITVYTSGASGNLVPGYGNYRLDLSVSGSVSLKDITGETFTGSFSATDNTLTLTGLSPQPTGSGGTLTYEITSISDDGKNLVLTATKASPKTGNTINVYTLVAN
ncbi:MAG: hypothetical protein KF870_11875 [Leadbetterella sp.]|nr:hypothetical protein [Leadbetterella sp.]